MPILNSIQHISAPSLSPSLSRSLSLSLHLSTLVSLAFLQCLPSVHLCQLRICLQHHQVGVLSQESQGKEITGYIVLLKLWLSCRPWLDAMWRYVIQSHIFLGLLCYLSIICASGPKPKAARPLEQTLWTTRICEYVYIYIYLYNSFMHIWKD